MFSYDEVRTLGSYEMLHSYLMRNQISIDDIPSSDLFGVTGYNRNIWTVPMLKETYRTYAKIHNLPQYDRKE